jgi:methylenetetrahydrofolate reductase (NADPH)
MPGVKQVLVVAGDNATPEGTITSGLQVLESGLLEKYGVRTVGVAGHPEGHREVSEPVLGDALRRKNVYAEKTGIEGLRCHSVYVHRRFRH